MHPDKPAAFKAYGLTFTSEIALPGLVAGEGAADVVIRVGVVDADDVDWPQGAGNWIQSGSNEIRLVWEGVGRFHVRNGAEVRVDASPDVAPEVVQQAVLGPVFCLVAQQRGWYPLHASAILVDDAIVALAGLSGSGKSSLAAALGSKGYPPVADDVTVIDTSVTPPTVRPGITSLKLWPDALERLGKPADAFPKLDHETEKRRLDPHDADVGSKSLGAVYLLDDHAAARIVCVSPERAVLRLLDVCQHGALMHRAIGTAGLMSQAARIAGGVPVFRFGGRSSVAELFETASRLEQHFLSRRGTSGSSA